MASVVPSGATGGRTVDSRTYQCISMQFDTELRYRAAASMISKILKSA